MDTKLDNSYYRATVMRYGVGERRILRQAGGFDEYAHVRVSVVPSSNGSGNALSWHAGSHIPAKLAGFVIDGAATALRKGIFGGIAFVDVCATIETGSYHESDSNGPAFREAAESATAQALQRADPVLLEAVVAIIASVPEEFTGVVQSSVAAYNEVIQDTAADDRIVSLTANLAASRVHSFISEVLENTQGNARFSLRIINFVESEPSQGAGDDWAALT